MVIEEQPQVDFEVYCRNAAAAARALASVSADAKNAALAAIADGLEEHAAEILERNREDIAASRKAGQKPYYIERMTLNEERIAAIASGVREVAQADDPIGEVLDSVERPNGLRIQRVRVPLGVIGVIYESRPNVTIDIASLCLKSGNAVIMRGGSDSINTNSALADLARRALETAGLPQDAIQLVRSTDRAMVRRMLEADEYIDLVIPRGSAELVALVGENAKMPAITGGAGVCHTYVDAEADLDQALEVVHNAKVQRHTVCNALDTVLVHEDIADRFLPAMAEKFAASGVELRVDKRALSLIGPKRSGHVVELARREDFGQEFLALVASVAVVDSMDEAMEFIARHGSKHSEAIITANQSTAERFLLEVDSAAVFWNSSIRFNDGGEFGLGAEVAVSTGKMHARGPVGMREITTYKWVVRGDGQLRE